MLYLVLAHDFDDDDAATRRGRVRQAHLDGVQPLADAGTLQMGGAFLDDDGTMRGSLMLIEADDAAAVRDIVLNDVYVRERVWDPDRIEIRPFRRAV
ncbi:MAG: YciI family protein [Trueperaceae bacterium]